MPGLELRVGGYPILQLREVVRRGEESRMCFVEPGQKVSRRLDRHGRHGRFGCRQMQGCRNDCPEGGQSAEDEWSSSHPDSKQQVGALLKLKILTGIP
jgi:hypothetical protein